MKNASLVRFSNLLLGGMACLLLALWLSIGLRHGWEIQHHLILVLVGALAILSRTLNPDSRLAVALATICMATTLYAGDVVFAVWQYGRVTFHDNGWLRANSGEERASDRAVAAEKEGIRYDTRNRIEVIDSLSQNGIRAVPSIPPIVLVKGWPTKWEGTELHLNGEEVLPLGGISRQVVVYCNEIGTYVVYQADEHGFRNPAGLWSSGEMDIAVLGDSFVHGACVPTDTSFPELIRSRYPHTLAVGRDGNGPFLDLATLLEYLPSVHPKVVVWVYYEGNDLSLDMRWEQTSPFLRRYLQGNPFQDLIGRQPEIDRLLADHVERIRESFNFLYKAKNYARHWVASLNGFLDETEHILKFDHLRGYLQRPLSLQRTDSSAAAHVLPPSDPKTLQQFREILRTAQRAVNSWGGQLVFVYLPQWERYSGKGQMSGDREQVLTLVQELRLPLIDLHLTFSADADPLRMFPLHLNGHYSIYGNHVVEEEIERIVSPLLSNREH